MFVYDFVDTPGVKIFFEKEVATEKEELILK